jgi:glycosyltransferase involved in cell wall biosynthesis
MRIAYILTSLGIGGAERQVVALASRMAARGHSVLLIVLRERQPEEFLTDVEMVHLDMRKTPFSILTGLLHARHLLRRFRPDLLHSHTYPANMAARLLRLMGAVPAVLSTIHNVYEGRWPRILSYRFTDFLTIHTTAVSETAAQRYIRLKAVPQRKCTVIQNAIDVSEFAPSLERRVETRTQLEAGESFVWLSAGRIVPAKDFPNLLQAFAEVRTTMPQTQLWIAGEMPHDESKPHAGFGFAGKSAIMHNVRWLGVRRDMPALLDAADAFVLASAWEGMPLVVGEAMAMEKPVVATDVGGVREMAGDTAVLVPSQHPTALAAGMLAAMRTPAELRHANSQTARQRIATAFNMNARADEWEAFYRSLVELSG